MIEFLEKSIKKINKTVRPELFAVLPLKPVTMKPMAELINSLLDSLLALAAGLAILFLIIGGIKYIRSWGDSEQMEKAKKMISYVIIGLVIILISYSTVITLDKVINDGGGGAVSINNTSVLPNSGPPGTIFTIKAAITAVAGVDSATTIAHIQNPDEADLTTVILFDDGAHSDGAAGDNIYGNTWNSGAFPAGPYFIDINACDLSANCKEAENI